MSIIYIEATEYKDYWVKDVLKLRQLFVYY